MTVSITIRDVPDETRDELAARAARSGRSLQEYLRVSLIDLASLAALVGKISADVATLAHADLQALRVDLFPYEPFAARIWELRGHLTCYDAWYVALAEYLRCPLVTLDARLARSPGLKCQIQLPASAPQSSPPAGP